MLFVCAATANRDPGAFTDPDSFDITADRGSAAPLTFGFGPHYCVGAYLARAELSEAFGHLAPRLRDLRLDGARRVRHDDRHLRPRPAALAWTPA